MPDENRAMNATGKPPQTERRRLLTIDFSASEYAEIIRHVNSRLGSTFSDEVAAWARSALLEWVRSADED